MPRISGTFLYTDISGRMRAADMVRLCASNLQRARSPLRTENLLLLSPKNLVCKVHLQEILHFLF